MLPVEVPESVAVKIAFAPALTDTLLILIDGGGTVVAVPVVGEPAVAVAEIEEIDSVNVLPVVTPTKMAGNVKVFVHFAIVAVPELEV